MKTDQAKNHFIFFCDHSHNEEHSHGHDNTGKAAWREYLPAIVSFVLLLLGIVFDQLIQPEFFKGNARLIWYISAYIPVGIPVLKDAFKAILKSY